MHIVELRMERVGTFCEAKYFKRQPVCVLSAAIGSGRELPVYFSPANGRHGVPVSRQLYLTGCHTDLAWFPPHF